ncbi:MAG: HEPN domain-containing protein [Candidatus Jordarchaeales archaeon]
MVALSRWEAEAERWLRDAVEDLAVAEDLLKTLHYAASCFHSQQAAEKALKSALYRKGVEARSHSVYALLLRTGKTYNVQVDSFEWQAKLLDKHYTPPRYPNLHPGIELAAYELYGKEDAEKCLEAARNVIDFVMKLSKS